MSNDLNTSIPPWIAVLAIIGAVILFTILASTKQCQPSRNLSDVHNKYRSAALVHCENAVKKRLRAPGTASFPWTAMDDVHYLGGSRYRVRSWVEADNALGGTVRKNYECTMDFSTSLLTVRWVK